MAKVKSVKWLVTGGLVLGVALMGGTAWATELIAPASSSTTINGGAASVQGTTMQGPGAHPWVAQIQAPAGRCLRLAVTVEGSDLGMQVAAPSVFTAFRNDDAFVGSCIRCPVVKIGSTPNAGFYTVSINFFDGAANTTPFTLRYAHYPVGNPNCAAPTTPNAVEENTKGQLSPEVSPQQSQDGAPDAP